jgi:predicted DNA-binding transcriptional regulator AlpA
MHQMATINQIIDVLGVSAPHITNLVERGDFPKPYDVACKAFSQGIPRGRKSLRFSVPEVQEWLDKRREEV